VHETAEFFVDVGIWPSWRSASR